MEIVYDIEGAQPGRIYTEKDWAYEASIDYARFDNVSVSFIRYRPDNPRSCEYAVPSPDGGLEWDAPSGDFWERLNLRPTIVLPRPLAAMLGLRPNQHLFSDDEFAACFKAAEQALTR